ncbi:hypothetical protein TD95_003745 [Thielaviopsis punctulata]|uniref:Uncharacterized protein n=1 Tax=Thielaviopsis punctulata TaxID=72032 RepID=A0A0F4ZK62_9PEZI|nr:hypothetical protein TD95_003745 [Thielaviopsis punctulata]
MAGLFSFSAGADDLGKKNDDLPRRVPIGSSSSAKWPAANSRKRSMRRMAAMALGAFVVYMGFSALTARHYSVDSPFYQKSDQFDRLSSPGAGIWGSHMPLTGAPPPRGFDDPAPDIKPAEIISTNPNAPTSPDGAGRPHSFNGPFKFENLAHTLLGIGRTGGTSLKNKNVLFAAGSYRSAAALIPLACKMSNELSNYVHFALVSKDDMDIQTLREINGASEGCKVIFHDARPDHTQISSTARMQTAAGRALYHINKYMHPQVVIIDGSDAEEGFFLNGFRHYASEAAIPVIQLPEHAAQNLPFLATLDSAALRHWHQAHVDIVVQAPHDGVGGLIRLLQSLSRADFAGLPVPHLTIEMPRNIDAAAREFLVNFRWPPAGVASEAGGKMFTVRHRVSGAYMSAAESAARLMESFWPTNLQLSHVLLLSPQTQVSRFFFQYVHYALLHYRYSQQAASQSWDARLLGISLDYPAAYLNGTGPFEPPQNIVTTRRGERIEESFLWQAPNSNAVLIYGDKWAELHGLVSKLSQPTTVNGVATTVGAALPPAIHKSHPSWLEYVLLLCRIRGYVTLYPSFETARTVASVHAERYTAPEESLPDEAAENSIRAAGVEVPLNIGSMVTSLDTLADGVLPSLSDVHILDWEGRVAKVTELNDKSREFMHKFRSEYGRCGPENPIRSRSQGSVEDLFCLNKAM